jgi:hypothetical protein
LLTHSLTKLAAIAAHTKTEEAVVEVLLEVTHDDKRNDSVSTIMIRIGDIYSKTGRREV